MRTFLLIFFVTVLVISNVFASDLSCGSKIISIGDRKFDILRKCGNPANVEVWEEVRIGSPLLVPGNEPRRIPSILKEYVTIEEWEYNLGPGRLIRYLRFENGILKTISTGDYGY